MSCSRKSNHVIRIICEGSQTEALFFNSLRDDILKEKYEIGNVVIKLKPEPIIKNEDNILEPKRGRYSAKLRKIKQSPKLEEDSIKGVPPLCWVNAGIKDLEDGIDEVWTAFDKDRHPKIQEAFDAAKKEVNGKKVNIAFSSICFEYYLLIHFEKIYHAFNKSECNEKQYLGSGRKRNSKTVLFHCMTDQAVKDKACTGDLCVNGYARSKNYWQETKSKETTYSLVKDKLLIGICNAVWLRKESEKHEADTLYYLRNPFTTMDKLIERLTGYKYIDKGEEYKFESKGSKFLFQRKSSGIVKLINKGEKSIIIIANSFAVLNNGEWSQKGNRCVLKPEDEYEFAELDYTTNDLIYVFSFENQKIIFHNYKI